MLKDGSRPAIVAPHKAETFQEGTAMVLGRESFAQVVGEDEVGVEEAQATAFGSFHDTDAPVVVGRVAVTEVIELGTGNVGAHVETLVADQHALEKGLCGQMFGSLQPAVAQETSLIIHEVCLAIDYGVVDLVALPSHLFHYLLYGCRLMQFVAGIQEHQIVACGLLYAFVHGIVEPLVGLAQHSNEVFILSVTLHVALYVAHGVVGAATIDDKVLNAWIAL